MSPTMVDQDWDHEIQWRIIYLPQDVVIDQDNRYKISFHGIASKVGFHTSHERITSSCDLHHDLEHTRLAKTKSEDWIPVGQHMKRKECIT
jgi:hypothetical protein